MSLSQDALTSLEAVKRYLSISSDRHDALITSLIEAVSAAFNAYTGRKLAARDYSPDPASPAYDPDNAVLDGSGHPQLLLPQYPVREIAGLELGGRPLPPAGQEGTSGWRLERAAGVLTRLDGVFPRGRGNVRVAYRAGFDPIPPDLAQAALEQTAVRFQESAAGHGRLGLSARRLPDGSLSYSTRPLLPQVCQVLDAYRNRSLL